MLHVAGNRIQDLYEIDKVADMPMLAEVSLMQNPIARKPNYRMFVIKRMPNLVIFDGREVSFDEKKRVEGVNSSIIDPKVQNTVVHYQQYPTVKVPVKLNPVNFDGVFNNMKY